MIGLVGKPGMVIWPDAMILFCGKKGISSRTYFWDTQGIRSNVRLGSNTNDIMKQIDLFDLKTFIT